MKLFLSNFSLKHPWVVILAALAMTLGFMTRFPHVTFDNDPENMLEEDEPVRLLNDDVKEKFTLFDFVIVGIVNDQHTDGIFNPGTLGRVHDLTGQLLSLRQGEDGVPEVVTPARGERPEKVKRIDLTPDSARKRILNKAFKHDPNKLFDEQGHSIINGPELISPSVVDNIKQAELGSLKLEYLMEEAPSTREQAMTIREDAMNNPLYKGTLVAEDGKAIAIYIPIEDKTYSYNVSQLVRALTDDWDGDDVVHITGLPVAEDTFGVEMLVQMATSAPMAGLAIFILLLLFFKRLSLIIAPMIVAIVSVVSTMGLLIGLGHDVHIMSSMIAIFLMPIAVADSVHILSEFFDVYHRFNDRAKTVRYVIGHLFKPMLYTSLTTMAGFASLGMTPIPPVRIFGLHVAFGVGMAWLLTMTFIPAYIHVAVSRKSLARLGQAKSAEGDEHKTPTGPMNRVLEALGRFSYARWKALIFATVAVIVVSVIGLLKIQVNDNPVKWFTNEHPIRVADEALNNHFGGTYTAYLTLHAEMPEAKGCREKVKVLKQRARERFAAPLPELTETFLAAVDKIAKRYDNVAGSDVEKCFVDMVKTGEKLDEQVVVSWGNLSDEINYLDPEGLTYDRVVQSVREVKDVKDADRKVLISRLQDARGLKGPALQERALKVCDEFTALSFREFMFEMKAELTASLFKRPEMLRYVNQVQDHLLAHPMVGKTSSAVDALKKAAYELRYVAPPADASAQEIAEYEMRNRANYSVPDSVSSVAQVYIQLEGMKKKDSLFHLVTRDYQEANIWVQLKSGDNRDMESVVADLDKFMEEHPAPVKGGVRKDWAGLTYLNVKWQEKMVSGMFASLVSSFIVVLIMMAILFRSPLFGILSMIPLSVTILFIYGLIGWVGKDYDMPVAVLSALTLGLSVDFAIHFLERAREEFRRAGSWKEASRQMFKEPAMAISRNAITISIGFTPLLVAPLVPYRTVGFFLATIMAVSWLATLFILPALLTMLQKRAFKDDEIEKKGESA